MGQDLGENILLRTYSGDAGQLAKSIGELRLVRDVDRMRAVEVYNARLINRCRDIGYLMISDLRDELELYLEDLVLDTDPRDEA